MTLRLSVASAPWHQHVASTAAAYGEMIPVVKGNGYGFGRSELMAHACGLSPTVAVGSVFEAHEVPSTHTALVLTPAGIDLPKSLPSQAVLTIGARHHVDTLRNTGWRGAVVVKLQSAMRRYGASADELSSLLESLNKAALTQVGWSVHPPLDGTSSNHVADVSRWLSQVGVQHPMYISHLDSGAVQKLRKSFPQHRIIARIGTSLWLGDKTQLQLHADVLDIHTVDAGMTAGYRNVKITTDGSLVLVGAGSAHGVHTVDNQLSPFHFQKTRLQLLEPSHMHTSMLFVANGSPCPLVGDLVEVQQPLTRVAVDTIYWT